MKRFLGKTPAQRQVMLIGAALWISWLVAGLSVLTGLVGKETASPYALGSPDGFAPLQLLVYPFLQRQPVYFLLDLAWLAGLVHIARTTLSPAGFVRLYSLGSVGGGLVYLLLLWTLGRQEQLTGGTLVFAASFAALAVLKPKVHGFLFGEDIAGLVREAWFFRAVGALLIIFAVATLSRDPYWQALRPMALSFGALVLVTVVRLPLLWLAVIWFGARLAGVLLSMYTLPDPYMPYLWALVAGGIAGVVYALIEKTWLRYGRGGPPRR